MSNGCVRGRRSTLPKELHATGFRFFVPAGVLVDAGIVDRVFDRFAAMLAWLLLQIKLGKGKPTSGWRLDSESERDIII